MSGDFKKFLDDIKQKASIAEIIKEHTQIKQKHGGRYAGKCPFHKDDTPSFSVDDIGGFFYCFGCLEKGDVITFTQKIYNISFNEAVERLANRFNIEMIAFSSKEAAEIAQTKSKKELILDALKTAEKLSMQILLSTNARQALNYLHKRGFNEKTIEFFSFGLFDKNLDDVLKKSGVENSILQETGIYIDNYNRFNGRITIPIKDKNGQTIGFGGRIYKPEQEHAKLAKYINSPETLVFKKNEVLFNYNNARDTKNDYIIVCEGYFDVIKLWQHGLQNAVAPMGTNITINHINMLVKSGKKILFCFDGDTAGKNASLRAMQMCFSVITTQNYFGFITLANDTKDPDEMLEKYGLDGFLQAQKNHKPIQQAYLEALLHSINLNDPKQKTALQKSIDGDCIKKIQDEVLAKNYQNFFYNAIRTQEFEKKYQKSRQKSELIGIQKNQFVDNSSPNLSINQNKIIVEKIEHAILKLLISNITIIFGENWADISELITIDFKNIQNQNIYETLCTAIDEGLEGEKIKSQFYTFYDSHNILSDAIALKSKLTQMICQHTIKCLEDEILKHSQSGNTEILLSLKQQLEYLKQSL